MVATPVAYHWGHCVVGVCGCSVEGRHQRHYRYVNCVLTGGITLSTGCSRGSVALVCYP